MSAMWVWLELVPLGALVLLVALAGFAHRKSPSWAADHKPDRKQDSHGGGIGPSTSETPLNRFATSADMRDGDVEPEWWPDFERDFALYVARIGSGRKSEASAPSRPKRPRN